ncbi:MAG: right-handed parallel beta-helix repeat-containing protein [Bythopirellula sp.]
MQCNFPIDNSGVQFPKMIRPGLFLVVALVLTRAEVPVFAADTVDADQPHRMGAQTLPVERGKYDRIVYVSHATGSDEAGDGSRAQPWKTIGQALDCTGPTSESQRLALLVAAGTYAAEPLKMRAFVDLYGGFRPSDWHRDVYANASILDGAQQRRVLVGADHSRLDGFLIKRGAVVGFGGAILCDGVSPTLTNNRFVRNRTQKSMDWQPKHLHQRAHDGGAICCLNGAKPIIRGNLFVENQTEIGRGGAISLHGRCAGEISFNVFLDNKTGLEDRHRSSDGGAISIFDWSSPRIENNVFLENKALNVNDGGAVFATLWSSPVIAKNIFVGNRSTDDGGALFVGGQEHRYDEPLDTRPDASEFHVKISANRFSGNENKSMNSGGVRLVKEARATMQNNILARDARLYIQESDVEIINNTILEDVYLKKMDQYDSGLIANNVFLGGLKLPPGTTITHSLVREGYAGPGNLSDQPRFLDDQAKLQIVASNYKSAEHVTTVRIRSGQWSKQQLANRIVRAMNRWGVIRSNGSETIDIWGDVSAAKELLLLPTFQLHPQSPGIDQGNAELSPQRDIHGDRRPTGAGVDIGADEVVHDI